jgi:ketosteroid isomerase-like protein
MTQHQKLIEPFYSAFQQRDYANMIACYHDDLRVSDPVAKILEYKGCDAVGESEDGEKV